MSWFIKKLFAWWFGTEMELIKDAKPRQCAIVVITMVAIGTFFVVASFRMATTLLALNDVVGVKSGAVAFLLEKREDCEERRTKDEVCKVDFVASVIKQDGLKP